MRFPKRETELPTSSTRQQKMAHHIPHRTRPQPDTATQPGTPHNSTMQDDARDATHDAWTRNPRTRRAPPASLSSPSPPPSSSTGSTRWTLSALTLRRWQRRKPCPWALPTPPPHARATKAKTENPRTARNQALEREWGMCVDDDMVLHRSGKIRSYIGTHSLAARELSISCVCLFRLQRGSRLCQVWKHGGIASS